MEVKHNLSIKPRLKLNKRKFYEENNFNKLRSQVGFNEFRLVLFLFILLPTKNIQHHIKLIELLNLSLALISYLLP